MEWCSRKETNGTALLLSAAWKMKEMRRNTDQGRCPICFGDEDDTHITGLLEKLEKRGWNF